MGRSDRPEVNASPYTPQPSRTRRPSATILRSARKIVAEGRLVRLGCGVYGLAFTSGLSDRPMLFHPHGFLGAARTALTKLGVAWEPTERERAYQEGRTTEVPEVPA